jgi:hypothetical protein
MELNKLLKLKPSEISRALLTLKGKPLNLDDYKPFEIIYDVSPNEMTLMAGRQIGKSVSLGAAIVANSLVRPHFSTLFSSPLSQQTSRFSTAYLTPFLSSPLIRKHFIDPSDRKNVFSKSFNNGSMVTLGYAETEQDADRIRGVFADALYLDEFQDTSIECAPILAETLGASDYAFKRYTGTAKTETNSLTQKFKQSNMMEWAVKCTHCGKFTLPIDFDVCHKILTLNKEGPGCVYCGGLLDMKTGKWVAAKPSEKDHLGFHLPQVIFPARTKPKKWKELILKSKTYSIPKLANEVFGCPSGLAGRPLSLKEVMACCNPNRIEFDKEFPKDDRHILHTVLGVDWSVSGGSNSYTVITVLGYDWNGKAYLLYAQRLNGIDILDQVKRVIQLYRQYQCTMIGSDRGVGQLQVELMRNALGHDRVNPVQYVAAKAPLRWDKEGEFFSADRTTSMDTMILKAKIGKTKIETPAWDIMSEFWQDALNIYEEESLNGRRLYRKDEDLCDDWFHSANFANIAHMILKGDFTYVDEVKSDQNDIFDF